MCSKHFAVVSVLFGKYGEEYQFEKKRKKRFERSMKMYEFFFKLTKKKENMKMEIEFLKRKRLTTILNKLGIGKLKITNDEGIVVL